MTPLEILATLAVLGGLLTKAIEALRRQLPWLHGLAVMAVAWALGAAAAWAIDLRATVALLEAIGGAAGREPLPFVDYLLTGAAIAAWSAVIADLVNRTGANAPNAQPERVLVDPSLSERIGAHTNPPA